MIYLFTGQPGSGKTTLAKKLQWWLQTEKKNWRKSVFHIDEEHIRDLYDIDIDLTKEFISDFNSAKKALGDIKRFTLETNQLGENSIIVRLGEDSSYSNKIKSKRIQRAGARNAATAEETPPS